MYYGRDKLLLLLYILEFPYWLMNYYYRSYAVKNIRKCSIVLNN